jgi:hypothetical protein
LVFLQLIHRQALKPTHGQEGNDEVNIDESGASAESDFHLASEKREERNARVDL